MTEHHNISELLQSGALPSPDDAKYLAALGAFAAHFFERFLGLEAKPIGSLKEGIGDWAFSTSGIHHGRQWEEGLGVASKLLETFVGSRSLSGDAIKEGYFSIQDSDSVKLSLEQAPSGDASVEFEGMTQSSQKASKKPMGSMAQVRFNDGSMISHEAMKALLSGGLRLGDQIEAPQNTAQLSPAGLASVSSRTAPAGQVASTGHAPMLSLDGLLIGQDTPALNSALRLSEAVFGSQAAASGSSASRPAIAQERMGHLNALKAAEAFGNPGELSQIASFSGHSLGSGQAGSRQARPVYGFYDAVESTWLKLQDPETLADPMVRDAIASVGKGRQASTSSLPEAIQPPQAQQKASTQAAVLETSLFSHVAPEKAQSVRTFWTKMQGGHTGLASQAAHSVPTVQKDALFASNVVHSPSGGSFAETQKGGAFESRFLSLSPTKANSPFASPSFDAAERSPQENPSFSGLGSPATATVEASGDEASGIGLFQAPKENWNAAMDGGPDFPLGATLTKAESFAASMESSDRADGLLTGTHFQTLSSASQLDHQDIEISSFSGDTEMAMGISQAQGDRRQALARFQSSSLANWDSMVWASLSPNEGMQSNAHADWANLSLKALPSGRASSMLPASLVARAKTSAPKAFRQEDTHQESFSPFLSQAQEALAPSIQASLSAERMEDGQSGLAQSFVGEGPEGIGAKIRHFIQSGKTGLLRHADLHDVGTESSLQGLATQDAPGQQQALKRLLSRPVPTARESLALQELLQVAASSEGRRNDPLSPSLSQEISQKHLSSEARLGPTSQSLTPKLSGQAILDSLKGLLSSDQDSPNTELRLRNFARILSQAEAIGTTAESFKGLETLPGQAMPILEGRQENTYFGQFAPALFSGQSKDSYASWMDALQVLLEQPESTPFEAPESQKAQLSARRESQGLLAELKALSSLAKEQGPSAASARLSEGLQKPLRSGSLISREDLGSLRAEGKMTSGDSALRLGAANLGSDHVPFSSDALPSDAFEKLQALNPNSSLEDIESLASSILASVSTGGLSLHSEQQRGLVEVLKGSLDKNQDGRAKQLSQFFGALSPERQMIGHDFAEARALGSFRPVFEQKLGGGVPSLGHRATVRPLYLNELEQALLGLGEEGKFQSMEDIASGLLSSSSLKNSAMARQEIEAAISPRRRAALENQIQELGTLLEQEIASLSDRRTAWDASQGQSQANALGQAGKVTSAFSADFLSSLKGGALKEALQAIQVGDASSKMGKLAEALRKFPSLGQTLNQSLESILGESILGESILGESILGESGSGRGHEITALSKLIQESFQSLDLEGKSQKAQGSAHGALYQGDFETLGQALSLDGPFAGKDAFQARLENLLRSSSMGPGGERRLLPEALQSSQNGESGLALTPMRHAESASIGLDSVLVPEAMLLGLRDPKLQDAMASAASGAGPRGSRSALFASTGEERELLSLPEASDAEGLGSGGATQAGQTGRALTGNSQSKAILDAFKNTSPKQIQLLSRLTREPKLSSLFDKAGGGDFAMAWLSRVDGRKTGLDLGFDDTKAAFGKTFGKSADNRLHLDSAIHDRALVAAATAGEGQVQRSQAASSSGPGTSSDQSGLRSLVNHTSTSSKNAYSPTHSASTAFKRTDWSFVDTGSTGGTVNADLSKLASSVVSHSAASQRAPMPLVAPAVKAVAQTALRDSKTGSKPQQPAANSEGASNQQQQAQTGSSSMSEAAMDALAVEMADRVARLIELTKERKGIW